MLKVSNLSYASNGKNILNDLSCTFESGTLCCILGKNGSGKSTMLKAIEGLIPATGEVYVNDTNINLIPIKEKAKLMAYLPQSRITPSISGRLMVEHGRFPYLGFSKTLNSNDKAIVDNIINEMGIKKLEHQNMEKMSGGEIQRIYIASTMAQQASVFLFDEPTTHLDLESQIEILKEIAKLKNENTTIVVVLHDLLQAFTFFDKIYLLDEGSIIESGTPESLISSSNIEKIFNYKIVNDDDIKSLYKYKLVTK